MVNDFLISPDTLNINYDNVSKIKYENILAFSYGVPGAMGDPGHLFIVHKNPQLRFYETNLFYNDDKELANKIIQIFPKEFEESIMDFGFLPNMKGWERFNMGFGNSIVIRDEYVVEFKDLMEKIDIYIFSERGKLYLIRKEALNLLFNNKLKNARIGLEKTTPTILGAIAGDVIGSRFEFHPHKSKSFDLFSKNECFDKNGKLTLGYFIKGCRFTDDTVMTLAIAKSLMECNGDFENLSDIAIKNMRMLGNKYPLVGYGNNFNRWLMIPNSEPYNSFGNGSAMRISAVPYFANDMDTLRDLTEKVTSITHNHPEGIKGACAVADCIWLALKKFNKEHIKQHVEKNYYKLDFDYDELLKNYSFNETCQGSVPQSIYAFLISESFEDSIRIAISMGGDADTMGAIVGAISAAYYGVPTKIKERTKEFLTEDLLDIVENFDKKFITL